MKIDKRLEVEEFLNFLKAKILIYDIIYENREKNTQALLDLGITEIQRRKHIENLQPEDFVSGPTSDNFGSTPSGYLE